MDKYEITMSSWDGAKSLVAITLQQEKLPAAEGLPATKVLPKLFDHCEVELREIMLDKFDPQLLDFWTSLVSFQWYI